VPLDREDTLRKAEKLTRQGRLDAAIVEYARVVEEYPNDWNSANLLGDLYARVGQADRAAAQWTNVASGFFNDGFMPRAAALYKKILKVRPDDEPAMLQLAEVAARQGLLLEAKTYLNAIAERRASRGDGAGADEIRLRLASLDPTDLDARRTAARILANAGDKHAAAAQLKAIAADLFEKGRDGEAIAALKEALDLVPDDARTRVQLVRAALAAGDQATAIEYLTPETAGQDPALALLLLDAQARAGRLDEARSTVSELLNIGRRQDVLDLAWGLPDAAADGAFVCIETIVDALAIDQQWSDAVALLEEFAARRPHHVPALLRLIEICVDSGLEQAMCAAQAQLADAYLATGRVADACALAADLVAQEPWDDTHVARFREALVLLGEPDPDTVIAQRLSGETPFVTTDRFFSPDVQAPAPMEEPPPAPASAAPPPPGASVPSSAPPPPAPRRPIAEQPPAGVYNLEDTSIDIGRLLEEERASTPPAGGASPAGRREAMEIDLTDALSELTASMGAPSTISKEPSMTAGGDDTRDDSRNLDEAFREFRDEVSRDASAESAAEHLALARAYQDMGMVDKAIDALQVAARSPRHRFEAASTLGRLSRERGDLARAVEWLERAAEAPAPSVDEGRAVLYELGDVLEQSGETMRALAVFLELEADAGSYRDVHARAERLSNVPR
jgi:tetratricopeptide (TPR) repeat protein